MRYIFSKKITTYNRLLNYIVCTDCFALYRQDEYLNKKNILLLKEWYYYQHWITGWTLQIVAIFKITFFISIRLTENLKTVLKLWGQGLQKLLHIIWPRANS